MKKVLSTILALLLMTVLSFINVVVEFISAFLFLKMGSKFINAILALVIGESIATFAAQFQTMLAYPICRLVQYNRIGSYIVGIYNILLTIVFTVLVWITLPLTAWMIVVLTLCTLHLIFFMVMTTHEFFVTDK